MVFLGLGKPKNNEEYIAAERKHDEDKRKKFLQEQAEAKKAQESTEPSTNPHDTTPKPKKSIRDKLDGTVHTLKVKAKARKLKRYKQHKEKTEAKAKEAASIDIEAEDQVFGSELSDKEAEEQNEERSKIRAGYNEYAAERKAVKAERRQKLKEGFSKLSSGESGLSGMFALGGGGGEESTGFNTDNLDAMFAIKSAPLDANVVDDNRQYGSKAGAVEEGNVFGLGDLGKENPFGTGGMDVGNPFDFNVSDDKKQYGKKAGAVEDVAVNNPFGLGDFGKNNPFAIEKPKDMGNPFDFKFLKESKKTTKKSNASDPFGIFGNKDLKQKKHDFERNFSLVWGEKPKGKKKVKGLRDPLGLV